MSRVRLYGRVLGQGSHVQVTNGFRLALSQAELLAGEVQLDVDEIDRTPPGAAADFAIFTGPLNLIPIIERNTRHRERWTMVAPNSDKIPPKILAAVVAHSTRIMTPSDWATEVTRAQLTQLGLSCQVMTVPHGVFPEFRVKEQIRRLVRPSPFTVLHFSTSDRQRKGTRELLQAWPVFRQHCARLGAAPPRLHLILDPLAEAALRSWLVDEDLLELISQVRVHTRVDLGAADMATAYASAHAVCQPSRGEGFGLIPLEARACGVPVVVTGCTGHSQHTVAGDPGVVLIPTGEPAPLDDWEGALAPSLSVSDVADALVTCYEHWDELDRAAREAAPDVQQWWSWPSQLESLLDGIREG